jgi:hypothetical protein
MRDIKKMFMISISVFFIMMPGSPSVFAENITLQSDPSPSAKVKGYKVYSSELGVGRNRVEDVGNVTTHVIRDLSRAHCYLFSITAYDASGSESGPSNEIRWGSCQTDGGYPNSDSGCLIAAVAYGHSQAEEVLLLRKFRDRYLATNIPGRFVVKAYGWISPPLTDLTRSNEAFRIMAKWTIEPVVYVLMHPKRSAVLFVAVSATIVGVLLYRRRKRGGKEGIYLGQ